jgi:RIO-like serine/threonine protein kinase
VSVANLTPKTEEKILSAFDEIHNLGILHGDVRPENILVGVDGGVWVIDFEFSRSFTGVLDTSNLLFRERQHVELMLTEIRQG